MVDCDNCTEKATKEDTSCDGYPINGECPFYNSIETYYNKFQRISPRLRNAFKDHEITVIEPYNEEKRGEYLFRAKDKWAYGMYIIFRPGAIIVYGDIRPCAILSQTGIGLPWLRGSVNDPNYLLEKDITGRKSEYGEENAWYLVTGLQMFIEALDKLGGS